MLEDVPRMIALASKEARELSWKALLIVSIYERFSITLALRRSMDGVFGLASTLSWNW